MVKFPYTQLHIGRACTVAIAGPHIRVVNSETGSLAASTGPSDKNTSSRSIPILFSCVNEDFTRLVTVCDDKKLKVWEIDRLKALSERELPKKPTKIRLTRDGHTIIVSDKFGDVYSYPLLPNSTNQVPRDDATSQENPSNGTLVLGHVSLVTTFLLTADENYIITADRDEHIRVSWYPQGYNIEMYCLGQEKFVSALYILPFDPSVLISAGGDPVIKIWDWMTGHLRSEIRIGEVAEPFIAVKGKVRKWIDEEEFGAGGSKRIKGRRARGRSKRKGKKQEKLEVDVEMENEDSADGVLIQNEGTSMTDDKTYPSRTEVEKLILAVHKIDSLSTEHGHFLLFDAYGCTALFCVKYSSEKDPSSSPANIHNFDFHKPVLDFIVYDGLIWVLLDGEWGNVTDSEDLGYTMVRVIRWVPDLEQFTELEQENPYAPLIRSLNTEHLIDATSEEFKTLDLYANLTSLPKNVDPSRDPMKLDIEEQAEFAAEEGIEITSRVLGRLKHKKALAAKLRQDDDREEEDERENKKMRSDNTCSDGEGRIDIGDS